MKEHALDVCDALTEALCDGASVLATAYDPEFHTERPDLAPGPVCVVILDADHPLNPYGERWGEMYRIDSDGEVLVEAARIIAALVEASVAAVRITTEARRLLSP